MVTALLGNQVQFAFDALLSSIEHIRSGRLRALGVSAAQPVPGLPDVPAIAEFAPGYEASGFTGLGAPRNTSADIIEKLNREISAAVADRNFSTRLADLGNTASALSPTAFGKLLADREMGAGDQVRRNKRGIIRRPRRKCTTVASDCQ